MISYSSSLTQADTRLWSSSCGRPEEPETATKDYWSLKEMNLVTGTYEGSPAQPVNGATLLPHRSATIGALSVDKGLRQMNDVTHLSVAHTPLTTLTG